MIVLKMWGQFTINETNIWTALKKLSSCLGWKKEGI